jgi:acetoin utilization protein AcuB
MTPFPYAIGPKDSVAQAHTLMQEHGIHHLPVVENFHCMGLITLEAVQAAMAHAAPDRLPQVDQLSFSSVYRVDINQPLEQVLQHMVERSVSCAVILKADKVVGIFTGVDACRLLLELLSPDLPDEAA